MKKSLLGASILGAVSVAASASAWAAVETTWRLDSGAPACTGTGASRTCASALPATTQPNVVANPWYFNSEAAGATLTNTNAAIQPYSGGVGVTANGGDGGSPNHSVDNYQKIDAVLFSFWDGVTLTKIRTGWVGPGSGETPTQGRDSDFSLLAYTGMDDPTDALSGKTAAQLLSNGWLLVNHYDGTSNSGGETKTVNDGSAVSVQTRKYWLLTAYDSHFGGSANGADTGTGQYDFLKLYSVSFTQNGKVPEPGSLALVGLALAGLWGARRRAKA